MTEALFHDDAVTFECNVSALKSVEDFDCVGLRTVPGDDVSHSEVEQVGVLAFDTEIVVTGKLCDDVAECLFVKIEISVAPCCIWVDVYILNDRIFLIGIEGGHLSRL